MLKLVTLVSVKLHNDFPKRSWARRERERVVKWSLSLDGVLWIKSIVHSDGPRALSI